MLRIRREVFLIWSIVLISVLIFIANVFDDTYMKAYFFLLFVFASWCILSIRNRIVDTLRVFTIFYFILFAFGPFILYIEGYDYYKEVGNLIIISYLCFIIGYQYGGRGHIKKRIKNIFNPSHNGKSLLLVSIFVFLVGMFSYAVYFIKNWHSIFIDDLENGRVEAMTGNGLFLWLGSLVWLAVYMMYEQYLIDGKYKRITYLMFFGSAIFSILLGFRSALVNPILVMFFMKNKKKEIPIQKMVFLALALFAFVGIYGAIRGGGGSSFDALLGEFKVSSVNLNYIINAFPKNIKYQMGATYFFDFLSRFNPNIEGITTWLKNVLKLSFSGGGVTPTLIGEFYINWGMIGVLIGMLISGSLFKRVDKMYRNPYNSVFLSCLILGYIRPIIRGGIANCMITLLVYVIGYCCCQIIAKKIKI